MDFVETEGDTLDEAIENALTALGTSRDGITVDVLAEARKGIFGFGAQKAKIRAALRKTTLQPGATQAAPSAGEPPAPPSEGAVPATDAAAVEKAKTVLSQILDLMGVAATIEQKLAATGDEIVLEIQAENSGLLIGRKGQTLEALQYLVSRIAGESQANEGRHIVIDVENYRERRRKALADLALRLGEKAKRQRKTVSVEALNAADRRIIHATLQDDPWVSTKSLGQGFYRRLLIIPEGDRKEKESTASSKPEKFDAGAAPRGGKSKLTSSSENES